MTVNSVILVSWWNAVESPASGLFAQTVCWGTDQRKHQSSALLAFVGGGGGEIHRWPMDSPHKGNGSIWWCHNIKQGVNTPDNMLFGYVKHASDCAIMSFSVENHVPDTVIAKFMGPTWGPSGADRTQVGPILAPWTLLSGVLLLTPNPKRYKTYGWMFTVK